MKHLKIQNGEELGTYIHPDAIISIRPRDRDPQRPGNHSYVTVREKVIYNLYDERTPDEIIKAIEQAQLPEKPKELRYYVINAEDDNITRIAGQNIGQTIALWASQNELNPRAKAFIDYAETIGRVYSSEGFMKAMNLDGDILETDYVFITNKY